MVSQLLRPSIVALQERRYDGYIMAINSAGRKACEQSPFEALNPHIYEMVH